MPYRRSAGTVGLKSDGTAEAVGHNVYGQLNVGSWTGITQVAAGYFHTVGLKSDKTVVAAGYDSDGECNLYDWDLSGPVNHCEGDYDGDNDVDGSDLYRYIVSPGSLGLYEFSQNFGKTNCS